MEVLFSKVSKLFSVGSLDVSPDVIFEGKLYSDDDYDVLII